MLMPSALLRKRLAFSSMRNTRTLPSFPRNALSPSNASLAIVQTGCRYVKGNVFILCGDDFAPFAVLELTADVPVCLYISEGSLPHSISGLFHDFDKVLWFKIASVCSVGQRNVECHIATLHVTSPILTMVTPWAGSVNCDVPAGPSRC